jgi:ubiquinone/menaquinone biosynthesis C-methylase UbiE
MEAVKKFWNERPCNIRHSSAELGTRQYFDEVEQRKYFVEPHIPPFADFETWSGKSVLEVGCGIGTDSINFLRSGANLTAIDVSDESVKIAKQRAVVYGFDPLVFNVANAEELYVPDKTFDLVYSFGVIHHSPHPKKIIEQIAKHQLPGQELRIMLYSKISYKLFWAMHTFNRWDMSKMNDTIREYAEAQQGCPYAETYTFDEVKELLHPWYEITDIHKDHIFKWDVEKYINKEYQIDSTWKDVDENDFRSLEKELGWHTLVKARCVKTA